MDIVEFTQEEQNEYNNHFHRCAANQKMGLNAVLHVNSALVLERIKKMLEFNATVHAEELLCPGSYLVLVKWNKS